MHHHIDAILPDVAGLPLSQSLLHPVEGRQGPALPLQVGHVVGDHHVELPLHFLGCSGVLLVGELIAGDGQGNCQGIVVALHGQSADVSTNQRGQNPVADNLLVVVVPLRNHRPAGGTLLLGREGLLGAGVKAVGIGGLHLDEAIFRLDGTEGMVGGLVDHRLQPCLLRQGHVQQGGRHTVVLPLLEQGRNAGLREHVFFQHITIHEP